MASMKTWNNNVQRQKIWHPANRLLAWCAFTIYISDVPLGQLLGITFTTILIAMYMVPQALKRSVRRMRWLFLTLIIVFAWSTPGVYVASSWYAPSIDGLYSGAQQALRLLSVIASLQISLQGMDQTMLLSACYQLSQPFVWLRVDTARFAVRLGLTLRYAEQWLIGPSQISWRMLGKALDAISETTLPTKISIEILPFSRADRWMSIGLLLFMVLLFVSSIWI